MILSYRTAGRIGAGLRRPAIVIMIGMASGVFTADLSDHHVTIIFTAVLISAGSAAMSGLLKIPRRAILLFLIPFLLGISDYTYRASVHDICRDSLIMEQNNDLKRTDSLSGKGHGLSPERQSTVFGTAVSVRIKSDNAFTFILKKESGLGIVVTVYGEHGSLPVYLAGRKAEISGRLSLPSPARNPGGFDQRKYLLTKSVGTVMKANVSCVVPGRIYYHIEHCLTGARLRFSENIRMYIDKQTAAVICGMMFGDRSGMDDEEYEKYRRGGTAHILAVSGLHVGFVYSFLLMLMGRRRGAAANLIIVTFLILYALMADLSPSAVRAAAMISMHIAADALSYRYDLLSAASIVMFVTLLIDPFELFSTGAQMSYLAVAVIAFTYPKIIRFHPALYDRCPALEYLIKSLFLPSAAIQAGMLPFTAYMFNYVSLGAFAANIPVILIAGAVIPLSMIALAACIAAPYFFPAAAGVLILPVKLMRMINELMYFDGRSAFDVVSPPGGLVILFYIIFFILLSEGFAVLMSRRRVTRRSYAVAVTLLLSVSALMSEFTAVTQHDIVIVDVGQGSCAVISTCSGKHIMIDGGGANTFDGTDGFDVGGKTVKPFLLKNGIRKIDAALITHFDNDHFAGAVSLCRMGMISKLVVNDSKRPMEKEIIARTGMKKEDIVYVRLGQRISCGGASAEILGPVEASDDENDGSLIFKLKLRGKSILFGGDITGEIEDKTADHYSGTDKLRSDLLCADHHGSRYSSTEKFLDAVRPSVGIFQTGKNNYGHPAPETIERFIYAGAAVFRTDTQGALMIDIENDKIEVTHFID